MVPAPDVLYLVPNTVPYHPAFERTLPTTPDASPNQDGTGPAASTDEGPDGSGTVATGGVATAND
jgi:hypothetical protein